MFRLIIITALGAVLATIASPVPDPPSMENEWSRLPDSSEISAFLKRIPERSPKARLMTLGASAGGRPVEALLVSARPAFLETGARQPGMLTVLVVGSQHGTEPAGCEALQRIAVELTDGGLQHHLGTMNFVLVVNANPDGRDLHRRGNASRVNLSTDFAALSQPECRAMVACLRRYRPDVLLDLHESAVLKKKSLGKEGYMTDFETQVEVGNHPSIDRRIRLLATEELLPRVISKVRVRGLRCRHYIGEILTLDQPVSHGGLSLRNLRNYASMLGTIAVLLETRLDPPGDWPTRRNLKARVDKQMLGIEAFLESCSELRPRILHLSDESRGSPEPIPEVALAPEYAANPSRPEIMLRLTDRASGNSSEHLFAYRPVITTGPYRVAPSVLYITGHQEHFARLLTLHDIPFSRTGSSAIVPCYRQQLVAIRKIVARNGLVSSSLQVREYPGEMMVPGGALRIDPAPSVAALASLLLDLRSSSTVFRQAGFQDLIRPGSDSFIVRSRSPSSGNGKVAP